MSQVSPSESPLTYPVTHPGPSPPWGSHFPLPALHKINTICIICAARCPSWAVCTCILYALYRIIIAPESRKPGTRRRHIRRGPWYEKKKATCSSRHRRPTPERPRPPRTRHPSGETYHQTPSLADLMFLCHRVLTPGLQPLRATAGKVECPLRHRRPRESYAGRI